MYVREVSMFLCLKYEQNNYNFILLQKNTILQIKTIFNFFAVSLFFKLFNTLVLASIN